jgi:hypothetical protein
MFFWKNKYIQKYPYNVKLMLTLHFILITNGYPFFWRVKAKVVPICCVLLTEIIC